MQDLHFAISIQKDALLGYIFVPFLLEKSSNNYYSKHKKITNLDVKNATLNFNNWQLEVIELCHSLTHVSLNKTHNKKRQKTSFPEFFKKADKKTQDYILRLIEDKQIKIIDLIFENQPLVYALKVRDRNIYNTDFIKITQRKAEVAFEFEKNETNLVYRLLVFHQNKQLNLQKENVHILTNNKPTIIYQNKFIRFNNEVFNGNKLKPFLTKKQIAYAPKHEAFLFEKFIKPAVRKFDCKVFGFELTKKTGEPKPELVIEQTIYKDFIFTPYFDYKIRKVPFYATQKSFVNVIEENGNFSLENTYRNSETEQQFLNILTKFGLEEQEKCYKLKHNFTNRYAFLEYLCSFIPKLQQKGFTITNHLVVKEVSYVTPKINYKTVSKQDWFDLYINVQFGKFTIEFQQLKDYILNDIHEFLLPDNTIAIIPDTWFTELQPFAKRTNKNNKTSIPKTHYKVLEENTIFISDTTIQEKIARFDVTENLTLPKKSIAKLRDYQVFGYNWLYSFTQNYFGVCLADDMGLGKTLQVITMLQKYFEDNPNIQQANHNNIQLSLFDTPALENKSNTKSTEKVWKSVLLVVPKSLIYNWIVELNKFAPEITYAVFHGNERKENFESILHKKNIIITTYGVVRQDIHFLEKHSFSYLILDESQAIKNPNSKSYQAIIKIASDYKVSITGTPIENNLIDLWAQMNFLNPNILGTLSYFKNKYITPIQNSAEAPELNEIKKIIQPFILRRLKKDVAKELPDKIEQIIYCTMHKEQAEWYEKEKLAIRKGLIAQQKEKNYVNVLAAINKLRQIAINPRLLKLETTMTSGKFESIIEQMESVIEQGHKFLVFSSFVKHLQLFESYFKTNNIAYSMLTGSDTNRKKIVDEYENSTDIKPFLISIKAGGVGLNLTSANYVFIIDPWWNPFIEQQAIDRTHRIGQDKTVMVYRFISKDSIEEKIINLQQSKLKMSDAVLEQDFTKNLKIDDLLEVLS